MAAINSDALRDMSLSVPNMVCDGCAERIRTTLTAISGVRDVKTRLWRKQVRVRFQPSEIGEQSLIIALRHAGFDARPI
jgi:copper chaperone CopZ